MAPSQRKVKAARINVTQAVAVSSLLLAAYSFLITFYAREVALLLGSSERLLPLAVEYMHWFAPFLPFSALLSSGMFFIRLDGSPNYAMLCNAVPAVINIVLDYVFIFILGWGMTGAALATSLGYIVGAGMILGYLGRRRNVVRFCRVKTSRKSMRLTLRNVGYMCRLGLSTFPCERWIDATTDAPTPNISPTPVLMRNSGAVMLTAASASLPMPRPTKIPSVITKTAEKTIPRTVGISSFRKSLGISMLPKSILSFIAFIFWSAKILASGRA